MADYTAEWEQDFSEERYMKSMALLGPTYTAEKRI